MSRIKNAYDVDILKYFNGSFYVTDICNDASWDNIFLQEELLSRKLNALLYMQVSARSYMSIIQIGGPMVIKKKHDYEIYSAYNNCWHFNIH